MFRSVSGTNLQLKQIAIRMQKEDLYIPINKYIATMLVYD